MEEKTLVIIVIMAFATFLTRVTPFLFLPGRSFNPLARRWLEYIPVAILAGLLGPLIFLEKGIPAVTHIYFLAALPTFLVAWRTRNMFATVTAGIMAAAFLRLVY